jgi:hypothetical protein
MKMFIFSGIATPFIVILKWIAEFFLFLSNTCYKLYDLFLGWSIGLNDSTESDVWIRDEEK